MIALGSKQMSKSKSALLTRILSDNPGPVRKNQMIRMEPALIEWVRDVADRKQSSMSDVVEAALLLLRQQLEKN
jgi:hypothetical protein